MHPGAGSPHTRRRRPPRPSPLRGGGGGVAGNLISRLRLNVSPSITSIPSPCLRPCPPVRRGRLLAAFHLAEENETSSTAHLASARGRRGPEETGARRARGARAERVGASFVSWVPNARAREEKKGPGPRPGLIPGSIPDPGVRLGRNEMFLRVEEPGLQTGRLHTLLPAQDRHEAEGLGTPFTGNSVVPGDTALPPANLPKTL